MSTPAAALVASFADRAAAAQAAEHELRERLNAAIAAAARERVFAFRRTRLIRALAGAADGDVEAARSAQRRAVSAEIGWSGEGKSEAEILDRLVPVADAVRACACGSDGVTHDDAARLLGEFEAWFEQAHGKPFYALFDQYVSEVPVVDF